MAMRRLNVEQANVAAPLSRRDFLSMHVRKGKRGLDRRSDYRGLS